MRGSYNPSLSVMVFNQIVALRNEKGSYNNQAREDRNKGIVALRNEKGSYNWRWYKVRAR